MSCYEIEALRLGLMNVLGTEDRSAREHAEKELEGRSSLTLCWVGLVFCSPFAE